MMKAVFFSLAQLLEEEVTGETEAFFRVLWRFRRYSTGLPDLHRENNS